MGIALIVVNGYCVSYSVDASFKASHSSPRLQLIAFACFMVEGRLVFFGAVSLIAYPLLYN